MISNPKYLGTWSQYQSSINGMAGRHDTIPNTPPIHRLEKRIFVEDSRKVRLNSDFNVIPF